MLEAVISENMPTRYPAGYVQKTPVTSRRLLKDYIGVSKSKLDALSRDPPVYPMFNVLDERLKLSDD